MKEPALLVKALRPASPLCARVEPGLSALPAKDRSLLRSAIRPLVGDSLDLDAASREELPEDNRWDYILSVPDKARLVGVEPHQAKDSEVSVVIAKKNGAKAYLRAHLVDGKHVSRWIWVSHGKVGFSNTERSRRRLDQEGIEFQGREVRDL